MGEKKYLNTSFNQARMSKDLVKYTTYPNGLIVFERNSGKMNILSTDELFEDYYDCYSISAKSFKEFIEKCNNFAKDAIKVEGKLYVIDLWKVESEEDVKFNERLIDAFSKNPQEYTR